MTFFFPEAAGQCCQHFLWTTEQCRERLIFLVISSFADLLNTIFFNKHVANKSQCSNIITALENYEWQKKKLEIFQVSWNGFFHSEKEKCDLLVSSLYLCTAEVEEYTVCLLFQGFLTVAMSPTPSSPFLHILDIDTEAPCWSCYLSPVPNQHHIAVVLWSGEWWGMVRPK